MADEIIGFKVQVNGKDQVINTFGEFRKAIKDAEFEALKLSEKFGATSKEALAAQKTVAGLKDKIKDAKEVSDLFDPGQKFKAFTGVLQASAGAISGVQGALGLLGVEGKSTEAALLKVQSAMALSQGLNTVLDSAKEFERLSSIIKQTTIFQKANNAATIIAAQVQRAFGVAVTQTSVGFKVLKGAIVSTGIGALVIGVGLLVNKIMDWINSSSAAERQQKKLAAANELVSQSIDREIQVLTALGGKEKEIYNLKVKQIDNELNLLYNKRDKQNLLYGEDAKRYKDLQTQKKVLDITEQNRVKADNEKKQKEAEDKAKKESDLAKSAYEKRKAESDKQLQEEIAAEQKLTAIKQENALSRIKDESKRAKQKVEYDYDNSVAEIEALNVSEKLKTDLLKQALIKRNLEIDAINEETRLNRIAKEEEFKKKNDEAVAKELEKSLQDFELLKSQQQEKNQALYDITVSAKDKELNALAISYNKQFELIKGNKDAELKLKEQYESNELEIKQKYEDLKLNAVKGGLSNIATLVGKQTAAGKAMAIASATIDTYQAANSALKANYGIFGPAAQVARFIAVAATIGAGIKNVKEIAKAKIPNTSSVSSIPSTLTTTSVPIQIQQPQAALTQLNSETINQLGNVNNKTYVLESDITNTQERITRINRAARLN